MTGVDPGGTPFSRPPRARSPLPRPLPPEFQAAFDQCYADVIAVAFDIALASVDSADAEVFAKDVGIALWVRWSADPAKCASDREWGAWTARAVRSRCIDRVRKIRRDRTVSFEDEDVDDVPEPEWLNPERRQELNELMDVIYRAIAGMSPHGRAAFVASQLEGASVASISAQLGITERNVRYHVGVGLKLVREAVHAYNGRALKHNRGRAEPPREYGGSPETESPEAT